MSPTQPDIIPPNEQPSSFHLLGWIWLGIFLTLTGLALLFHEYRALIPDEFWLGLTLILLLIGFFGWRRQKVLLKETSLFLLFLILGIGIGLITQLFDIPIHSGWGLLIWAILSFAFVLASHLPFLSFLWIPLFLGGIAASFRFEFLMLFLTQAPSVTVFCISLFLFALADFTDTKNHPFCKALNRWSLILLFLTLFIAAFTATDRFDVFVVSALILIGLSFYAAHHQHLVLFSFSIIFLGLRTLTFTFAFWRSLAHAGIGLTVSGLATLLATALYNLIPPANRR